VHSLERLCHQPIPAFHDLWVGQRPMTDCLGKIIVGVWEDLKHREARRNTLDSSFAWGPDQATGQFFLTEAGPIFR
jgi:hypothetical protein